MPQAVKGSFGPTAVALWALHDRAFFTRLLEDTKGAVASVADRFGLTETDKAEIIRLIESRGKLSPKDAQALWDKYHRDGIWGGGNWPMGWTPWGR